MAYKGKLKQKTGASTSEILHPETDASITLYSNTIGETSVTTVKDALDEIITAGVGVTGVKGNAETNYRTGEVNLTPANIGAVAANNAITAKTGAVKINYDTKGLVTGSSALAATDIPNLTLAKITDAGTAAAKGVATTISSSSTDNDLATAKAVYTAIDNLPEPMVFKGTLGTSGTVTTLPTVAKSNEGHTYKVITAGTYASQSAKVGDVFVSNGTAWVLIPSGDDVEDTWRAIKVNGTQLLGSGISTGAVNLKNGGNITVSGSGNDITLGVASGYSIPSTANQTTWTNKQDALDAQTAYSAKGTTTKVPQITTNALGQVTLIEEKAIAFPDITVASTGSGNAITAIAVDSSNKHKINVTKGSTFLTSQSLAGYTKMNVAETISGLWTFQAATANTASATFTVSGGTDYLSIYSNSFKIGVTGSESATIYSDNYITIHEGTTDRFLSFIGAPSGTILTSGDVGSGNGKQLATVIQVSNKADKANITAGTYSAVSVNTQGIVTGGGQVLEVIEHGATPTVANGGWFFEKDA